MAKKKKPAPKSKHRTERPDLSIREVRFCRHYAEHGNATQAFHDAGFEGLRTSAAVTACRLLRKRKIRELIRKLQQDAIDAAQITVDRLVASLGREAFTNRVRVFDQKGQVLPPDQWPPELQEIVVGLRAKEHFHPLTGKMDHIEYDIRFCKPTDAKRMLGQYLGLFGNDGSARAGEKSPAIVVETETPPS